MPDDLILIGLNHRSADGLLREQFFLESEKRRQGLRELRDLGLEQALLLSTCDRLEVVIAAHSAAVSDEAVLARIAAWIGAEHEALLTRSYCLRGADALHHIFAVTAALDSQVLGEPYVLGQVKESHRLSESLGMCGPGLDKPLQAAFRVAKRVRSETSLAERPATLAASALRVARDLYGRLEGCSLLLIGSGEMGEILASEFRAAGMEKILVAQRRPVLAQAAAERLAGHYLDWTEWAGALESADVVLCANGDGHFLLDRRAGERLLKQRRRRPLLFLDTGVPRDIEPEVNALDGAFVYDLHDLEQRARAGQQARQEAATQAWGILSEELENFQRETRLGGADTPVVAFRRHCEELREEVLADGKLDAEAATRLLLNRLLHEPSRTLREMASENPEEKAQLERFLERLFRIDTGKGKNDR